MSDSLKVVVGPVKSGGIPLRLVKLPDGSGRVESWNGTAWVLGGGDGASLLTASPMSPEALAAFGIPD